jgi:hypothetical protein
MPKTSRSRDDFPGRSMQKGESSRLFDERHAGKAGAARIHRSFVDLKFVPDPGADPPLSRMLSGSGGRGGETRLKTYLTLLWIARADHSADGVAWVVDEPRATLGRLIGAYDDDTGDVETDRRRDIRARDQIDRSLQWLEGEGFIKRKKYSSLITLLDDKGSSGPYIRPGESLRNDVTAGKQFQKEDLWIKVPAAFWLEGWIGLFRADELAAYLCLLTDLPRGSYEWAGEAPLKWSWWSQSQWAENIRLKRDMRYSGFNKLASRLHNGDPIVLKQSAAVSPDDHRYSNRTRKKYALNYHPLDGRFEPMPPELKRLVDRT